MFEDTYFGKSVEMIRSASSGGGGERGDGGSGGEGSSRSSVGRKPSANFALELRKRILINWLQ